MTSNELNSVFNEQLSTPLIADACIRGKVSVGLAPFGIKCITPGLKISGPALCVKHFGSVDVFIEAIHFASPGDILLIDNEGRTDEGCIGDLIAIESMNAGIRGIVLLGTHRDTQEIKNIGLPVFSLGHCPLGPARSLEHQEVRRDPVHINFGAEIVSSGDYVFADDDGVISIHRRSLERILDIALELSVKERTQAELVKAGESLFKQFHFENFIEIKKTDPAYSFRAYLRETGGAIEE